MLTLSQPSVDFQFIFQDSPPINFSAKNMAKNAKPFICAWMRSSHVCVLLQLVFACAITCLFSIFCRKYEGVCSCQNQLAPAGMTPTFHGPHELKVHNRSLRCIVSPTSNYHSRYDIRRRHSALQDQKNCLHVRRSLVSTNPGGRVAPATMN